MRKVRATFSNGVQLLRSSTNKIYTHAWLCRGTRPPMDSAGCFYKERKWSLHGFSTSAAQAQRNMDNETAFIRRHMTRPDKPGYSIDFSEVVEVEEVVTTIMRSRFRSAGLSL